MSLFAPGRRWFAAASIATIVVAALHTLGNTVGPAPTDAAYLNLDAAMRSYVIPLGLGMSPVGLGDLSKPGVHDVDLPGGDGKPRAGDRLVADASPRLIARAALVLAVSSAALTALFLVCQITPALVSMAVVTVLYGMAAMPTRALPG